MSLQTFTPANVLQLPIRALIGKQGGLFRSFWMGGYEGADHINSHATSLHLNHWNGHWTQLDQDYAQLAGMGIRTIRESIGWRISTTRCGQADLRRLRVQAELAQAHGLQVIWTIHHYGLPPDVDFFASDFAARFAEFCAQVSAVLTGTTEGPEFYQPINEISFMSWAATCTRLLYPYQGDSPQRGYELKCRLVEATLRGCDAIWSNAPDARIVHTDPIIHITAAPDAEPYVQAQANALSLEQYQAWDMIGGTLEPALGGAPRYLDILGVNYYHGNQWEHPSQKRLHWHLGDARRLGLETLLGNVWARYQRPLFLAETSHVGAGRAPWLEYVAGAALRAMHSGIPLEGICLYPLIDRTDWEEPARWHHSGLWDVLAPHMDASGSTHFGRVLHEPYARSLQHWQALLPPKASSGSDDFHVSPVSVFSTQPEVLMLEMSPLIVFSHLRWDFVYQRPQQLLSRFAMHRRVIFVEEPIPNAAKPVIERMQPCQGVEVLRCHVTGASHGFTDEHLPVMKALLAQYLAQQGLRDYWLWFYTPMAVPLAAGLQPLGVVYDCMDELSAFRHAPPELLLREDQLFNKADLVFTGGHSLYEAKARCHPRVSCFPSSVDAVHYARPQHAGFDATDFPEPLQAHIPQPRLGYCGVIDERVDLRLVEALADARPQWQIVMVGPVVKIDPASLPQRTNIHWLGQKGYAELPGLIHGWDVCLMPFALNESTRFISPTKTLEYLAAGCPVVSTPIRDVVTSYPSIVAIAHTPAEFVSACEAALNRTPDQVIAEAAAVHILLERTSWDRTAAAMAQMMDDFGKNDFENSGRDYMEAPRQPGRAPAHSLAPHAAISKA